MSVPVVILCGGMGTRLREETEYRPKPMVEIGGRPILWHIMRTYAASGHDRFILCLGYKGHMIKEYFLNYRGITSDFTISLGEPGGLEVHRELSPMERWKVTCADTGLHAMTGARVRKVLRYIDSETFCLTYGDGLTDVNVQELVAFHRRHGRIATVTAVRAASRFGELGLSDDGSVVSFSEKPEGRASWINGGYFVFDRARLAPYLEGDDNLVLEAGPLERLARAGELMAYHHDGFWQCMDTYREWKLLESLWAEGRAPWVVPS